MTKLRLFFNLRSSFPKRFGGPESAKAADWDIPETVSYLTAGLEEIGYDVLPTEVAWPVDFGLVTPGTPIMSICEMIGGSWREAIIPMLCESIGLQYVFSPPDVLTYTLDKHVCNLLARNLGVPVPNWALISRGNIESVATFQEFPIIVKPRHEGSGIGISDDSVVWNRAKLKHRVELTLDAHDQDVIVQKYVEGEEVTVGVVGRSDTAEVFWPLAKDLREHMVYCLDAKEVNYNAIRTTPRDRNETTQRIRSLALGLHNGLDCRDASRLDFRIDGNGVPQFLEINPLPHLHPEIGDYCQSAYASGHNYLSLLRCLTDEAMRQGGSR